MADQDTAQFGGGSLHVDTNTGVLTWGGSDEVVILRVELINHLFRRILKIPAFSLLLRDAGIAAGQSYASASLAGDAPRIAGSHTITDHDQIAQVWEYLNEQDAFSGWGRAKLIAVDKGLATATIEVTQSFTGRERTFWESEGFGGTHVCNFLEGYFLGEAYVLLNRQELTCKEVACQLDGQATCQFQIQPMKIQRN